MKTTLLLFFLLIPALATGQSPATPPDTNVNSQYTVESVEVKGLTRAQFSDALYDEMQMMKGKMLDQKKVDDLRARLRDEPQVKGRYGVSDRIERGSEPEHVKLIFEATKLPWALRVTLGKKIDINGGGINEIKDTDAVESAEVKGVLRPAYSDALYADIQMMVGKRIDHLEADHLKEKLEAELKGRYTVTVDIRKGTKPDSVLIVYFVKQIPWIPERTFSGVAAYHPKQGISTFVDGRVFDYLTLGLGTDGETLSERYKGYMAGLESQSLGTRRLGAKINFETFGILWKPQTLQALLASPDVPGAYRRRQAVQPSVAFAFNRTLYATAGLNLTELQMMLPAEHWQSAHEATASLRYKSPSLKHKEGTFEFTSGYEIRTATRNLDSDFIYTRHVWDGSYSEKTGKWTSKFSFIVGRITGNPPLFERFSMGSTTTARGWNKYDIDPIGGTRIAHASTEWTYSHIGVFLDNGAIWSAGQRATNRASVGLKLGPFKLAFPLHCSTHCGPTFMIAFE